MNETKEENIKEDLKIEEIPNIKELKKKKKAEKKKKSDEYAKKVSKRTALIVSLVVLITGMLSGGYMGGWYIKNFAGFVKVDYEQYRGKEMELRGTDLKEAKEKYSPTDTPLTLSKKFSRNGGVYVFSFVEDKMSAVENLQVECFGSIQASIANQSVYNYKVKKGQEIYSENLSGGMMAVGEQVYVTNTNLEQVNVVVGKEIKELDGGKMSAKYSGDKKSFNIDEFKEENGVGVYDVINYLITSQTTTSSTPIEEKQNEDGTKTYKMTLEMDKIKSVIKYAYQVKRVSGLVELPTFNNVKLEIELHENFLIKSVKVNESYVIKYNAALSPTCVAEMTYNFTYANDVELPYDRILG